MPEAQVKVNRDHEGEPENVETGPELVDGGESVIQKVTVQLYNNTQAGFIISKLKLSSRVLTISRRTCFFIGV